ncbi:hypothetical protein IQ266_19420 [filamentous cyanobacterium LEGE 11480]|uniref:Sigma-70 family RNA polymerase sigma factor n=1 Tax=Romeriopsis navalis LEGE 11480 TaxID=2777977 RepID=A0A928Z4M1_9CYAN|nr:hypothetical protein [Romeriopsis navalis]MBE9031909.1 hypothetical protein [Romeriopsis navalis LEGE 11480]
MCSNSSSSHTSGKHPIHQHLRELLETARAHPPNSLLRRKYLNQLILAIQKSNRLYRGGASPEHYQEALSMTWLYVVRSLDKYDPSRAEVLTWINFRLSKDIKTVQIKATKEAKRRLNWVTAEDESRSPVDRLPARQDAQWVLTQLNQWLQNSSDELISLHVRGRPDLHCRQMIEWHLLAGDTFQTIAARENSPTSTLSSFWYKKCVPQLQEFSSNLL